MTVFHTLVALAALTVPAVVTAAPAQSSIAVEVGDLDLVSEEGQRVLAMRIQRAARAICKAQTLASLPQNIRNERGCIRNAQVSAKAQGTTLTAAGEPASNKGG